MACTILDERRPFVAVPFFWSQQHYAIAIDYVGHLEPWRTIEIEGSYSDPGVTAFLRDVPTRRTVQSGAGEYDVSDGILRRGGELETMMVDEGKATADRPVTVPLLHVRLAEQLERLKQESTRRTRGHDAITLTKEPALRLVLMLFSKRDQAAGA